MLAGRRPGRRAFNPRFMSDDDWSAIVGLKSQPTGGVISAVSQLPSNGYALSTVIKVSNKEWSIAPGAVIQAFFQFENVRFNTRLAVNHNMSGMVTARDSEMFIPLSGMVPDQPNGGAWGDTQSTMRRCDLTSVIDGHWPGNGYMAGLPALVEWSRLSGPGRSVYRGFPLRPDNIPATVIGTSGTTGIGCTNAQLDTIVTIQASTYYAAGQLVNTINGDLYQVSQAGTSGSGTVSGGPWWQSWIGGVKNANVTMFKDLASNSTAQPFADGPNTLKLIYIGEVYHGDGIQVARAGTIDIQYCKISKFSNSCMFLNSSAQSYDSTDNPTGSIRVRYCDLQPIGNQWVYVNTNIVDSKATGQGNVYPGRYQRDLSTGAWTAHPTPWFGRPERMTFTDNLFRDRTELGTWTTLRPDFTPNSYNGALWAASSITFRNGAGSNVPYGDYPAYVRSEDERNAAIARQFNIDGSINTAVLESRWQSGLFPGACDARSWIVFARNYDERGNEIYPTSRQNITSFDMQGYYTGV